MKKYFYVIVLLCVLIVLFGCYFLFFDKDSSLESVFTGEVYLPTKTQIYSEFPWQKKNYSSYEIPQHTSEIAYGKMITDPDWTHTGEINRYYDQENDQWIAKIQGYAHTYVFEDFGILLGTNQVYDEEFIQKEPIDLIRRYKDDVYDVVYKGDFYVQRFEKSKNQKFDIAFLHQHHAVSGCNITTYSSSSGNPLYIPKNYIIYSLDFTEEREFCDFSTNNVIYFVYNPQRPEYYYKLSWGDGCAPSCGIPEKFEILRK